MGAVNFRPRHFFASATWGAGAGQRAVARHIWRGMARRLRNGLGRTERAPCSAGLWGAWIAKTKTAEAEARRAATGTARQRREGARAASRRQGEEGRFPNRSGAPQPDATARAPRTPRSWAPSRAPARRSGSRFRAATVRRTGTPRAKSGQEAPLDRQSEMPPVGEGGSPGPTAQLGFRRPPAHRPTGPARLPEKRRRRLPRPGRPW